VTAALEGRAAVVTGGARGIGRAIVEALAAEGCAVVVNCNASVDAAEALARELRGRGGRAVVEPGSVAQPGTGPRLVERAVAEFGRLDVLVNNAGITRDVTVRKMTDEQFGEVLETNLTGAHRVAQAALEPMCEAGYGRIVNVASFVGQLGNYGQANYAAAKGGLIAWTKALAVEVARFGITVNCVCPGFVDTDMLRAVPEPVAERLLARIPLGRFGTAEEIARGVLYLVRDGDYVTGSCLNINGGVYL
jgi:acetoacetyl-CoA reductase